MPSQKKLPSTDELVSIVEQYDRAYDRWMRRRFDHTEDGLTLARLRLLLILESNGPQRMRDLADSAEVAPRTVTALVDGLEREGLARRVRHRDDRRSILVKITDAGKAAAASRSRAYSRAKSDLYGALTDEERQQLFGLFARLVELTDEERPRTARRA